jgi:hypothetical protein
MGRKRIEYTPALFVVAGVRTVVATLIATTVALGTTAPDGSVTVPVTAPVTVCARPGVTQRNTMVSDPTNIILMKLIFIAPKLLLNQQHVCESFIPSGMLPDGHVSSS